MVLRRLPGRQDKNSEEFMPIETTAQAAKMGEQVRQMMDAKNKEMKDETSAGMYGRSNENYARPNGKQHGRQNTEQNEEIRKVNEKMQQQLTMDTCAKVSILRRRPLKAKDLRTIPETIRLKTVTGESTPIMGEAEVEICIGQLKIKYRALVANIEDDLFWEWI